MNNIHCDATPHIMLMIATEYYKYIHNTYMYLLHTYFLEIHFSLNACDVNSHENLFACTGAPILMNLRN